MKITPADFKAGDRFLFYDFPTGDYQVWTLLGFGLTGVFPRFEKEGHLQSGFGPYDVEQPSAVPIPGDATKDQVAALISILHK